MAMSSEKRAAMVASLVAGGLVIVKMVAGILSASVAVLASAIDSALDLAVSGFNLFAISSSEKPASERFNYGLGKIEGLAAAIEGTVIIMSGLFIFYQAVAKAVTGAVTSHLDISLGVMLASLLVTALLVTYLAHVARTSGSLVVKADALHYRTDLWANGGILVSLVLVRLTGLDLFDALVGAFIAIYIIYSAFSILREGVLNLLDVALEPEMVENIRQIIRDEKNVSSHHFLRTRRSGGNYFVDAHLVFRRGLLLDDAHDAADNIEKKIAALIPDANWVFNLHLDPVDDSLPAKESPPQSQ